jgi:hypothetical protein
VVNCKLFQLSRKALRDFLKHLELWSDINFRPVHEERKNGLCSACAAYGADVWSFSCVVLVTSYNKLLHEEPQLYFGILPVHFGSPGVGSR